ncbi:uncharacterized protein LOC101734906 [Xenopus tropicalis]|uniref:Uncharacterized protein LOC101734906 n=1 Tax=Xenopus tropicalis TaxID=8364 RepID=A0A8J1JIL5_XENTR|nr:uncharacterized protein LOC101734906 [Xenopus tropicalis]
MHLSSCCRLGAGHLVGLKERGTQGTAMAESSVEPASPSNTVEMRSASSSLESGEMDCSESQDTDGAESKDCEPTVSNANCAKLNDFNGNSGTSDPNDNGTNGPREESLDKKNGSEDGNKATQIFFVNQMNIYWSPSDTNQGEKNHPKRRHSTGNEESESKRKKPTRSPLRDTGSNATENAS